MNFKNTLTVFFTLLLFSNSSYSAIDKNGKIELEYQNKTVRNTSTAKQEGQDWDDETLNQLYGNVGFSLNLWQHKILANWFFMHTKSNLVEHNTNSTGNALNYSLFPKTTVARDLFKLRHMKQSGSTLNQSVLNRFVYEWGDDEVRFKIGRMFINFGEGFSINPLNPFSYSSSFSSVFNVRQGNDGFAFLINKNPDLKLNIYILADKSFTDYDDTITRTIFLHGDWLHSKYIKVNYILGEDQKRHKYGAEVKYQTKRTKIYAQAVKLSQRLDNDDPDAKGLFHYLLGYKQKIGRRFSLNLETGKYQKENRFADSLNNNFIPFENILAVRGTYAVSDFLGVEAGIIQEPDAKFSLYNVSAEYMFKKHYSVRLFSSGPIKEADKENISNSRYLETATIPYEVGAALRATF